MNKKLDRTSNKHGLVATGSAGCWNVAVDESLDRQQYSFEIDTPNIYLVFQLRDLQVIPETLRFLTTADKPAGDRAAELALGRFGSASVSLFWDNEPSLRCFLTVGPKGRSTLRLTLGPDDIRMLTEAVRDAASGLPPSDQ